MKVCEECKQNPSKYECPSCSLRSCSLPCVKAHKQRTGCTEKRKQTQFDDNLLLSDYNLLEEMKRAAESAQRMRVKLSAYPYFKLPYSLLCLKNAAGRQRIKLFFALVEWKKSITWTIEWRFHSTKIVLLDHGCDFEIAKDVKPLPCEPEPKKYRPEHR
ncbi:Zinc finger, HIT-type, partial [Dillenia turbinata]